MKVAEKRARIRGLDNIMWIKDRIENIPHLNLGQQNIKTQVNNFHKKYFFKPFRYEKKKFHPNVL